MISAMLEKGQINFIYYTKSFVPLLHKFTIQNLDLILFPFFVKLNLLNIAVFLLTCQHFGRMEKNLSYQKLRLDFTSFSQFELGSYARKVQGELLGCFFHCTLAWLQLYVPTTSFRLIALRDRVECQCYKETNIPLSQFKNATKNNMFNFILCKVRLIIFNTNLNTKNNISYVKTVLKKFQITVNFVELRYNHMRPVLISI